LKGVICARATEAIVIVRIAKINSIFRIIASLLSSRERDIHDTAQLQSQKEKLAGIPLLSEEGWREAPGWFQSSSLASLQFWNHPPS
jgi:hypothetical protein